MNTIEWRYASAVEKAVAARLAVLALESVQPSQATMAECLDVHVRRLPEVLQDHLPEVDVNWEPAAGAAAIQRWKDLVTEALRQILMTGEDALKPKPLPLRADPSADRGQISSPPAAGTRP